MWVSTMLPSSPNEQGSITFLLTCFGRRGPAVASCSSPFFCTFIRNPDLFSHLVFRPRGYAGRFTFFFEPPRLPRASLETVTVKFLGALFPSPVFLPSCSHELFFAVSLIRERPERQCLVRAIYRPSKPISATRRSPLRRVLGLPSFQKGSHRSASRGRSFS